MTSLKACNSMKRAVKIANVETEFFSQGRGVKQGCSLSPDLFNIYTGELAKSLEQSDIPGLTLSNAYCLQMI